MQKFTGRHSITPALHGPLDPVVKELITAVIAGLDGYDDAPDDMLRVLIVEPGDAIASIDAALGFSLLENSMDGERYGSPGFEPSWEWIEDHGSWFEAVFIIGDAGDGWGIYVANREGVDPDLLALCRQYGGDGFNGSGHRSATDSDLFLRG